MTNTRSRASLEELLRHKAQGRQFTQPWAAKVMGVRVQSAGQILRDLAEAGKIESVPLAGILAKKAWEFVE